MYVGGGREGKRVYSKLQLMIFAIYIKAGLGLGL